MKTIHGTSSEIPVWVELVSGDDVRASKKLITEAGYNSASTHVVLTNDDLLTEILLRLPVVSVLLFKSVSKQWLRIITSHKFTLRRSQIPHLDLPSGLFVNHIFSSLGCDFLSLDSRIQSKKSSLDNSFTLGSTNVFILQSCNGLLLCSGWIEPAFGYVYNPSTKLFKMLPQPTISNLASGNITCSMRLAFDPTKSLNYKVMLARRTEDYIQIQTYSSETGNWSICNARFPFQSFYLFGRGIYWNDAIHWLHGENINQTMHFKLDIVDHVHPILTTIQTPQGLHPDMKLFESRGCLLLLCRDYIPSREFSIREMKKGCSVWSAKYLVNTVDFITPLPELWSICSTVWSIVLGEREEDSFMVIKLAGKAVEYKILSKTLRKLCDLGSYDLGYTKVEPIIYQFIASLASV